MKAMSQSSLVDRIPPEVLAVIFNELYLDSLWPKIEPYVATLRLPTLHQDRKRDMQSCAGVSKYWSEVVKPFLFRDIVVAVCSLRPTKELDVGDLSLAMSGSNIKNRIALNTSSEHIPRCANLATLHGFFFDRPDLSASVHSLRLALQSNRHHIAEHSTEGTKASFAVCRGRDDYPVKVQPGQVLSVLALFPHLRSLVLHDVVLDLSATNGTQLFTYSRDLDRLSVSFPARFFTEQTTRPVKNVALYESVTSLLGCFGEINNLHLWRCTLGGREFNRAPCEEEREICLRVRESAEYHSSLQLSNLILQDSYLPCGFLHKWPSVVALCATSSTPARRMVPLCYPSTHTRCPWQPLRVFANQCAPGPW